MAPLQITCIKQSKLLIPTDEPTLLLSTLRPVAPWHAYAYAPVAPVGVVTCFTVFDWWYRGVIRSKSLFSAFVSLPFGRCYWQLAAACLAVGYWLLTAACLAAGCWLLPFGCWLLAVGSSLLAFCWLLAAGCWLLAGFLPAIEFYSLASLLATGLFVVASSQTRSLASRYLDLR
jgi:hypothetical protein